jgi:hypothetical protein
MKALILTPRNPYQTCGGDTVRVKNIIKALQVNFNVTVFCLGADFTHTSHEGVRIHTYKHSVVEKLLSIFRLDVSTLCLQTSYFRNPYLEKALAKSQAQYSIIIIHTVRMAFYRRLTNRPLILEYTDLISRNHASLRLAQLRNCKKVAFLLDSYLLGKMEQHYAKDNVVCFIARNDARPIEFSAKKTYVIPNPHSFEPTKPMGTCNSNNIVFIGNLRSEMNYDGIVWFLEKYSALLSKYGSIVYVLGEIPRNRIRRVSRYSSELVRFLGFVEDPRIYARQCRIGVAPVLNGAGQQNKILDYLTLGLQILTTDVALAAYSDFDLLAHDVHSHSAVESLLSKPNNWNSEVRHNLNQIRDYFSETRFVDRYNAMIECELNEPVRSL